MSRGLMNLEAFAGARIRIMPDCHAGAGCVIGFTADLGGADSSGSRQWNITSC